MKITHFVIFVIFCNFCNLNFKKLRFGDLGVVDGALVGAAIWVGAPHVPRELTMFQNEKRCKFGAPHVPRELPMFQKDAIV